MSSGMDWGERQPSPALLWSSSGVSSQITHEVTTGRACEVKSRYMQARLHDCVTCCVKLKRVKDVAPLQLVLVSGRVLGWR
jgi:hypothetical protein